MLTYVLYFGNTAKNHYCWIKILSRLLNDQLEVNNRKYLNYSARTEDALMKHHLFRHANQILNCLIRTKTISYSL